MLRPNRCSNFSKALSSTASFFNGWRSTPGTMLATSQLDRLSSITAISVPSGSRGFGDRLRSFNFLHGALHRFTSATMDAISSPPPHSISLGGLRTPTPCAWPHRHGGRHPKTFTTPDIVGATVVASGRDPSRVVAA